MTSALEPIAANLTALRSVEAKIKAFYDYKLPCGFNVGSDTSTQFLDPRVYVNLCGRELTDSLVNSTVRVMTAVPTTMYDLSMGIISCNGEQLKDGIITIPKAVVHLGIDAGKATCICGGVAIGTVALISYGILCVGKAAINGTLHLLGSGILAIAEA